MEFATQSYYDAVVAEMLKVGFRFIAQVLLSTDDLEYFVPIRKARSTTLVFDVPGKACFVYLRHREHFADEHSSYYNHWSMGVDVEYVEYVPTKVEMLDLEFDDFRTHWKLRSDNQRSFRYEHRSTGYGGRNAGEQLEAAKVVASISLAIAPVIPFMAEKFQVLSMVGWPPLYTFSGQDAQQDEQRKCSNLFWERFGAQRELLKTKIVKLF